MKLSAYSFIDDALPLSNSERRAIVGDAWRLWMKQRLNVVLYTAMIALPNFFTILMPSLWKDYVGYHAWYHTVIGFACYTVTVLGGLILLQRFRFAPCVYEQLRRQGHDVCPRCGYWLRGLDHSVTNCPECGASRMAIESE